jgi:hypothetical protein
MTSISTSELAVLVACLKDTVTPVKVGTEEAFAALLDLNQSTSSASLDQCLERLNAADAKTLKDACKKLRKNKASPFI